MGRGGVSQLYQLIKIPFKHVMEQDCDVWFTLKQELEHQLLINEMDSLFFAQIRRLRGNKMRSTRINDVILLSARKSSNKESNKLLAEIMRVGFKYNGILYKRFGKSNSQAKEGVTIFVAEDILDELYKISQLDIEISKCVIPKYESQRNLICSTATIVQGKLPYIIIVDEYTKVLQDQQIRYVKEEPRTFIHPETGEEINYKGRVVKEGTHDIKLSPFDGCGVHVAELGKRVEEQMALDYRPVGLQIRLPFMKGYSVEFDIQGYCASIGVEQIVDVYGVAHRVADIDCIWNTTMFKGHGIFHKEYGNLAWGKYLEKIQEYDFKLAISKYSHHVNHINLKSRMNFQYLQCLDLERKDKVGKIAKYTIDLFDKIIKGDLFYTYKFLGMHNVGLSELAEANGNFNKAILINPLMLKDAAVQQYIYRKLKKAINQAKLGKVYVEGFYHTLVGDVIGYMEYVCDKKVVGSLRAGEFYCPNLKSGKVLTFRSPLVCPSEVNDVNLVEGLSDEKWFEHFKDQDVVMYNMYDLSLPRMGGADADGDACLISQDPVVLESQIHKTMIIDIDDKVTAQVKEYNVDNITEYEMNSRDSRIGEITNIATSILNTIPTDKGYANFLNDNISLLRIFQGKEIDSIKTGMRWVIPQHMRKFLKRLPYFLLHNYPDKLKTYNNRAKANKKRPKDKKYELNAYYSKSPMNRLCRHVEDWERSVLWNREYTDTADLLINRKIGSDNEIIFQKVRRVLNDFARKWIDLRKIDSENPVGFDKLISEYRQRVIRAVGDKDVAVNYLVKVTYSVINYNKVLLWRGFGDEIIQNLIDNTEGEFIQVIEQVDEQYADYEFLGKGYRKLEQQKISL